jgi:Co/Zn/Cd efflux system component
MQKTTFEIQKMDCASEESMVRMKLEGLDNIKALQFDLANRRLDVIHEADPASINAAIESLRLDSKLVATETIDDEEGLLLTDTHGQERKLLWQVLAINAFFFALEIIMGFVANSMGLVADSLDMLADALVYALALFAVGSTVARKKNIAKISGYFQLALAVFGFMEVVRRFLGFGEVPAFQTMIIISTLALMGNATSLYLLQRSRSREAHMQASMIFTSNDVIINIGVIIAGALVYFTASNLPDLIVGTLVFILVARGSFRILQLAK